MMLWGTLQVTAFGGPHRIQNFDRSYKRHEPAGALFPMGRIDPARLRGRFRARNVQVDYNRLLAAAHHHRFNRDIRIGVDFLMRNIRRNEDEVTRSGLIDEFQLLAPAESGTAFHYIQHRFEIPVVVRSGFRVGLDDDSSGPQLTGAGTCMIDRRSSRHSFGLWRVTVQLIGMHNTDAVELPIGFRFSAHA